MKGKSVTVAVIRGYYHGTNSRSADHLKNAFDLGKCTVLRELNLQSSGNGSTGWWLNIGNCKQLRKLNLRNQAQAKTGGSTSTELDLSAQTCDYGRRRLRFGIIAGYWKKRPGHS